MNSLGNDLCYAAVAVTLLAWVLDARRRDLTPVFTSTPSLMLAVAGGVLNLAGCILTRSWLVGLVTLAILLLFLRALWRRRKRSRRLRALGARAKARLAAMKKRLQERSQPRPALRPVPVPR
jgi:hypothetical protein